MTRLTTPVLAFVASILALATGQAQDLPEQIDFNRDIRPILSDHCYKCHGPDEESRESDLRLDDRESAEEVISGADPAEVELILRIESKDEDEVMPPPDAKLALDPREKKLLRLWVEQGAPYAKHWAFEKPKRPQIPSVKNREWPENEIDFFVLAELERKGLLPAGPAGRARLIRRVTFDLTGLPPTLEEVRNFVNDQSPDAYEKLIDELLDRPTYGERMTAEWLDVARYSDSYGYQVDRGRYVWPWRDWVIDAFNRNMPYDRFILEQLAGDMLPNATDEQVLATAFNRLHPQKVEGGSVPEEFRTEYVADRTHTVGTAFLGLALECARCHDHKYDPITQKEYYQLFAYFNNIDEAGLYSYFTSSTPTPTLLLASQDQKKKMREIESRIRELEEKQRAHKPNPEAFHQWLSANRITLPVKPIETNSFEDFKSGRNKSVEGRFGKAVKLTGDDAVGLKTGNFTRNQPFSISLWINTPDFKQRAVVLHRSRAWTDAGSRGYQMLIEEGKLSVSLIHFWPGNAIRVRTSEKLPVGKWVHVGFSYDGSSRANGLRIYVNGKPASVEVVRDHLYKNITGGGGDRIAIGERFRDLGFKNGLVDEVKVFDQRLTDIEFEVLQDPDLGGKIQSLSPDSLPGDLAKKLTQFYREHADPEYREIKEALKNARTERSRLVDGVVEIMVMNEMNPRRPTHWLLRGAYDKPQDLVEPGLPRVFESKSRPQNRLQLAQWLISRENPLTARVTVNRYWQLVFGEGLVRTPEDFGSQGDPPTHPELLDWLAVDFMEHGWDLKRLIKQMVMSSTYRQDSTLTREKYRLDPENRLLSHANSYRLSAEMLRDNMLFVSGLLVEKIGGPGAKPYDLPLSFKPIGADKGEGLYRRSVYTYWKRTGPSPVMMTLDAAKRDVCTVKRERTATPLQSFVLLNDPQFVEAARTLAVQLHSKYAMDAQGIESAFELLTSRHPSKKESQILGRLLAAEKKYFHENPDRLTKFLNIGQRKIPPELNSSPENRVRIAALTTVIQTIMNFDECVMKR